MAVEEKRKVPDEDKEKRTANADLPPLTRNLAPTLSRNLQIRWINI